MNHDFESLPWHDARIVEVLIDRRQPGNRDEIAIKVIWPSGDETTCFFRDCYAASLLMNFGVIAEELVLHAHVCQDDSLLDSVRKRWGESGVSLPDLMCFEIETSSTASKIKILARQFESSLHQFA
jgi:hypothetical protein